MILASTSFHRSLAAAVVLVAALRTGVVEAQQPPQAALEIYTANWRAAVRAHVGGTFDAPAAEIARWPNDRIRVVVDRAVRQLQREGGDQRTSVLDAESIAVVATIITLIVLVGGQWFEDRFVQKLKK